MSSSEVPPYDVLYSASISLTASTFVSGISWGVMTSLYSVCMYSLVRDLRSTRATRRTAVLTVWITALWILSSLSTIANAYSSIYAYSWQLDYSGGPNAYLVDQWNKPIAVLAYSTYILTMWLADAMMVSLTLSWGALSDQARLSYGGFLFFAMAFTLSHVV